MFAYIDRIPSFYYQLKTIFSQLMPNCGLYLFSGQGPTNFLTHCRTVELSYIADLNHSSHQADVLPTEPSCLDLLKRVLS